MKRGAVLHCIQLRDRTGRPIIRTLHGFPQFYLNETDTLNFKYDELSNN